MQKEITLYMTQNNFEEKWKVVEFNFDFTNSGRIEVSNFGRLRTFNKISNGNIINGSLINGYRILRLKLYKPRDEKIQTEFNKLQQQIFKLARQIKLLKDNEENEMTITKTSNLLNNLKKNLSKKFKTNLRERTINYHSLVHRLVADYFITNPSSKKTIVAHLDYNKLNNKANNLKWMTSEENYKHQKNSPHVINEKQQRQHRRKENSRATKLSVTKVMLLKKLINQGKTMKQLVKQFKVSDTQIFRIKRGENWADIVAAN